MTAFPAGKVSGLPEAEGYQVPRGRKGGGRGPWAAMERKARLGVEESDGREPGMIPGMGKKRQMNRVIADEAAACIASFAGYSPQKTPCMQQAGRKRAGMADCRSCSPD